MAPESETQSTSMPEFLSDLGRSVGASSSDDGLASELMRVAGDPLLLRSVLSCPPRDPTLATKRVIPAVLVSLSAAKRRAPSTYEQRHLAAEPLVAESLHPERFVPTPEERREVRYDLEIACTPSGMKGDRLVLLVASCALLVVLISYGLST